MKKVTSYITIWILFLSAFSAYGQIPAPQFLCVENDNLHWEVPVVGCGSITGYEIFSANTPSGPFTSLTTIADPTQTTFAYVNPGNIEQYFYIITLADCPGEPNISSDTLDNRNPPELPIDFVSVNGNAVEIHWSYLTEPDVVGYIVYKSTPAGSVPIDTVTTSPYLDVTAMANNQTELYFVNALDACGNASFFDVPHNTILLDGLENNCNQTIDLNWNAYQNWPQGVNSYEVYVTVNSGQEVLAHTVSGADLSFAVPDVKSDSLYSIRIAAVAENTGFRSFSNVIAITPQVTEKLDPFTLFNVDVISPTQVVLEWFYDGDLKANTANVSYACSSNDEAIVVPLTGIAGRGQLQRDTISGVNVSCVNTFSISAQNPCDSTFTSNSLNNIVLTGEQGETNTILSWNPLDVNVLRQSVIKNSLNAVFTTFDGALTSAIVSSSIDDPSACYEVIDSSQITLPNGVEYGYLSHSNSICVFPALKIFIPNVFAPEGIVNRTFRPFFNNEELISSYDLKIYDRFGGVLFQSTNPVHTWDGTVKGKYVDTGLYAYALKITTVNDETILRKDGVMVLR